MVVTRRVQHTGTEQTVSYQDIVAALAPTLMVARGGFHVAAHEAQALPLAHEQAARSVVIIGNVGGAMWSKFTAERTPGPHPLDRWTRDVLGQVAADLGATFVHPSDEPFHPFQQWAQRADDVWQSPIGLLIHREHGLWHAYRGAFLFADHVDGLPVVGTVDSPCVTCADQPCLSTCPVDAFGADESGALTYDAAACRVHVASSTEPRCGSLGCAARGACPVNSSGLYGAEQMEFHMAAFVGRSSPPEAR